MRKIFTEEENVLFIERYKDYTNLELIEKFYPDMTKKKIWNKVDRMRKNGFILDKSEDAKNRTTKEKSINISIANKGKIPSKEHMEKLWAGNKRYMKETNGGCLRNRVVSEEERKKTGDRVRGKWAGDKNPRHKNPLIGENNGRWLGGIKNTTDFLRSQLDEWKSDSMKKYNYKCALSKEEFDEIHHLYPFSKIVDEVFSELKFEVKETMENYTKEEIDNIVLKIKEIHKKYPLGVCLKKDIHKQFHDLYGYTNNTKEQFDEFSFNNYNIIID